MADRCVSGPVDLCPCADIVVFGFQAPDAQHLRAQLGALQRDNQILKRAVAIQHERHLAHEAREQEVNGLKQMLGQYQEQLRKLEVSLLASALHSCMPSSRLCLG